MTNKEAIARINNLIKLIKSPRAIVPYCPEEMEALDLAIKALEESEQGKKEPEQGKFECRIKIKDLISMLLEFDMNDKATICTTDEYKKNNIVISITDERYKEE